MDRRSFLGLTGSTLLIGSLPKSVIAAAVGDTNLAAALISLSRQMDGYVLLPGVKNFRYENMPANDRYERITPFAIAMCKTPKDVVRCVHFCRNTGIQPTIRGGGHNYAGASSSRGLLIKTTLMNDISSTFVQGKKRIRVDAGALNRNLLANLRGGEWMLPIGTCPTVGVAGLTLGGGIGDNSRWAGMTSDCLVETDIVLASGELVTANSNSNSDLFWACRGGAGGNFGVNTSLTFDLVQLKQKEITIFGFRFGGVDRAIEAFTKFDNIMQTAPVELSGFMGLTNQHPLGSDSQTSAGTTLSYPEFSIDGCYQGSVSEARDLLAPLISMANPLGSLIGPAEFWWAQISYLAVPDQPKHGFAECARYCNSALPQTVVAELVNRVMNAPGGTSDAFAEVRLMCWSGGSVINGIPRTQTAYVHRNSTTLLRPAVWWRETPRGLQNDLLAWMNSTYAYIQPYTQPESFQNWPDAVISDWPQAYYGENLHQLMDVKTKYDPHNLFRYSQSIPVRSHPFGAGLANHTALGTA